MLHVIECIHEQSLNFIFNIFIQLGLSQRSIEFHTEYQKWNITKTELALPWRMSHENGLMGLPDDFMLSNDHLINLWAPQRRIRLQILAYDGDAGTNRLNKAELLNTQITFDVGAQKN